MNRAFSISQAQRANHAVFALCRGEKTSVAKQMLNNGCPADYWVLSVWMTKKKNLPDKYEPE